MKKNDRAADAAGEARRRARILDRYIAIESPTAKNDEATAADLGLAVESMIRLAKVWRRSRSELMLIGKSTALAAEGGAANDAIMAGEIDLAGVRPDRRDEILRRIRVIQAHIAATQRGEGDIGTAAARLGVSVNRFRVLLQTWMLEARAEALPGATRRSNRWRRQPRHTRRLALVRSAIEAADPRAPLRGAYDAFVSACLGEGLTPLSLVRFYALAQETRNGTAQASGRSDSSE